MQHYLSEDDVKPKLPPWVKSKAAQELAAAKALVQSGTDHVASVAPGSVPMADSAASVASISAFYCRFAFFSSHF